MFSGLGFVYLQMFWFWVWIICRNFIFIVQTHKREEEYTTIINISVCIMLHFSQDVIVNLRHGTFKKRVLLNAVDMVYKACIKLILFLLSFSITVISFTTICSCVDKTITHARACLPYHNSIQIQHVCTSGEWGDSGFCSATGRQDCRPSPMSQWPRSAHWR